MSPAPPRPGPPPPPTSTSSRFPARPARPAPARGRRPGPGPRADAGVVLKAVLEYDGGRYRGWQSQVNARTVQGVFSEAVRGAIGEDVRIHGAGRTDAGVHALGQVASLHLPPGMAAPHGERLRYELNDRLPADVNVLSVAPAPSAFHARHAAALRIYRYRIARRRTAFGKPFVWWVKERLDEKAMARAAAALAGRHDFAGFCENAEGHDSTLVEVSFARLEPAAGGDLLVFRIGASHFLWKMVRRIVGALVETGAGRLGADALATALTTRTSDFARLTAPPSGLFLESVIYPGDPAPPEVDPLRPAF